MIKSLQFDYLKAYKINFTKKTKKNFDITTKHYTFAIRYK